jgi:hypothetical protein
MQFRTIASILPDNSLLHKSGMDCIVVMKNKTKTTIFLKIGKRQITGFWKFTPQLRLM